MTVNSLRKLALILEKHSKDPNFDPYYDLSPEDKAFLDEVSNFEEKRMADERDSQGYIDWINRGGQ